MGVVSAPSVFIQLKNLIVRVHSLSTESILLPSQHLKDRNLEVSDKKKKKKGGKEEEKKN